MARGFVVEGKGKEVGGIGRDADFGEAADEGLEVCFGVPARRLDRQGGLKVRRMQRIGEERVLDVGGDELKMLLLMLKAEHNATQDVILLERGQVREQGDDGCIHVGAVGEDGVRRRAGEAGAEVLGGHVAEGVVVGVEEPREVRMEGLVLGREGSEDKGFKEPAGMGEMPLDGAGLRAGLDIMSSGESGATKWRVSERTERKRSASTGASWMGEEESNVAKEDIT